MSNIIPFPTRSILDKIADCQNPSDLVELLAKYDWGAANHVQDLFDKAFIAGVERVGAVKNIQGFIRTGVRFEDNDNEEEEYTDE